MHLADEQHDYGPGKRQAMYPFLAKHLGLHIKSVMLSSGLVDEGPSKVLSPAELAAFDVNHPIPAHAVKGDEAVSALLK